MKINLFFFGKQNEITEREQELMKRIGFRAKIEVIALPQAGIKDANTAKQKEGESLLKKIEDRDYLIAFDEHGEDMDSPQFSHWLKSQIVDHGTVHFIIGGAHGLSDEVLQRANKKLRCGRMVWTRNLFRNMALEQLYRALEIDGGGRFHK